jgi:hypothetical protein
VRIEWRPHGSFEVGKQPPFEILYLNVVIKVEVVKGQGGS